MWTEEEQYRRKTNAIKDIYYKNHRHKVPQKNQEKIR